MRYSTFFLLIVVLGLFQITVLDNLRVFQVKPDLLLVIAVFASLNFRFKHAVIFSVIAGLIKDIFAIQTFGINILLFALFNFIIWRLSKQIEMEDDYIRMSLVFICALAQNIVLGTTLLYSGLFIPPGIFIRNCFLGSIYTLAAAPLLFMLFRKAIYIKKRI